ncbi:hypothetical protein LAZ67_15002660 [Cordylochernes scorpioides]|uniref:HTH CENPB-type domain-containing protein n=1 Tax=Cordylochernes scorpioides TaxID=51811 RepID=A0ABY6LCC8_9ARAC|nr:hypothetical protein LAZ67_15002660 [Cordylochernes scorpioides]
MGQDNFEASNGWLEKFKARRNIAFKRLHGEAGSVDANSVATWKGEIIPSLLAKYSPQDIFNADKTGLFYKLLPNQTMTIRGEKCEGGFVMDEAMEEVVEEEMNRCFEALKKHQAIDVNYIDFLEVDKDVQVAGEQSIEEIVKEVMGKEEDEEIGLQPPHGLLELLQTVSGWVTGLPVVDGGGLVQEIADLGVSLLCQHSGSVPAHDHPQQSDLPKLEAKNNTQTSVNLSSSLDNHLTVTIIISPAGVEEEFLPHEAGFIAVGTGPVHQVGGDEGQGFPRGTAPLGTVAHSVLAVSLDGWVVPNSETLYPVRNHVNNKRGNKKQHNRRKESSTTSVCNSPYPISKAHHVHVEEDAASGRFKPSNEIGLVGRQLPKDITCLVDPPLYHTTTYLLKLLHRRLVATEDSHIQNGHASISGGERSKYLKLLEDEGIVRLELQSPGQSQILAVGDIAHQVNGRTLRLHGILCQSLESHHCVLQQHNNLLQEFFRYMEKKDERVRGTVCNTWVETKEPEEERCPLSQFTMAWLYSRSPANSWEINATFIEDSHVPEPLIGGILHGVIGQCQGIRDDGEGVRLQHRVEVLLQVLQSFVPDFSGPLLAEFLLKMILGKNVQNVQKITDLIKENPRTTFLELEQDTGISKTTIGRIVTKDLKLKKTPAKFIPRFLTNEQKLCRLATCENMLEMTRTDPEWKDKIITGDETWVYDYDPETKRQYAEWRGQGEPRPKKSRILKSRNKVLLVTFLDNKGIVHHEYLPAGQTVIKEMY